MGASLDELCPECRADLSAGLRELAERYPEDRIALLSHLRDATIRGFFGTYTFVPPEFAPMSGSRFEAELRLLGATVLDPATANAKYFFTAGTGHPTLEDPTVVGTPSPGLEAWLELMLTDDPRWESASD